MTSWINAVASSIAVRPAAVYPVTVHQVVS